MTYESGPKLIPISSRHEVEIVRRGHGLDIGELTRDHYGEMQKYLPNESTIPITLGVFYDLPPDPRKFDPNKSNVNNRRHDLHAHATMTEEGIIVTRDDPRDREFAKFLRERGTESKRLTGSRKGYLHLIVYENR